MSLDIDASEQKRLALQVSLDGQKTQADEEADQPAKEITRTAFRLLRLTLHGFVGTKSEMVRA